MPKKTPTVSSFYIKILLAFLLAIGILAAIGLFTMQTVLQMSRNNEVVLHSYKIKENLAKTLLELTLSQNDLRAYYLTDKKQYLYLYRGRIDSVRHSAAIVEGLIADKMYQHLYFKTLDSLLQERFTFNDKKIRMAYFQGHDAAEKKYSTERNQKILGEIENVANQLDAGESRLLESQIAESRVRINKTILFLSAGGLTSVAILLFVFLFLNKEVNRRTEAENE
ncbi:MAG: CHASE3 domain-containing protein, partial [Bacteroidota bacterium]